MHIYKQYDQASLNHQYNNRELVPNHQEYFDLWVSLNAETLSEFKCMEGIPYGDGPRQKLDFYPAARKQAPTMIFIHGGYWQMMDRSDFSWIARAFVPHGMHTIIIGYPIAPTATMDAILESVRMALTWIHHHISEYGGDPNQLFLCGHSAGGHLTSMMVTEEFAPDDIQLKGAFACSGLYNLIPIQRSHVNGPIGMDAQTAERCSPMRYTPNQTPLVLAVGGDESEEYHAQTLDLAQQWSSHKNLSVLQLPGVNHFSIVSELLNEESELFKKIISHVT